jgi:hypothetical protein
VSRPEVKHRERRLERVDVADPIAALDLGPGEVRDADVADQPLVLERDHGAPGFLNRYVLVGPVELIQVDHIDPQPLQAVLAGPADLVRAEAAAVGLRGDLGGHDDAIPAPLDGPANEFLALPVAVDLGGIDPRDPGVQPGPDRIDHDPVGLVRPPGVAAGLPRPVTDHRDGRPLRSELVRAHR